MPMQRAPVRYADMQHALVRLLLPTGVVGCLGVLAPWCGGATHQCYLHHIVF